jgi:isopentenyl diphosphate isomerase/L-lactate dehydrogenase-like FMN-dependent dehydrogenase
MKTIETTWRRGMSRRTAMTSLAGVVAGSPLFGATLSAQLDPRPLKEHTRLPGFDEMMTSFDFEPLMFANVPLATYDYTAHGDGSEFTLRRNRQAFEWVNLLPSRPVDPKSVDLATEVLGTKMKYPIIVAPSAFQVALHPDGEIGMRRGAAVASATPMILSANTSTPVEKVAAERGGPLWAQFYPQRDADTGKELLDRMQAAGCTAIVITVDQQGSYYERTAQDVNLGGNPRTGRGAGARGGGARGGGGPAPGTPLTGPARYRLGTGRLWYTWQYLDDIRKLIKVPMLVKGILTAEDARLCVEHGIDGIIVSNHGGRSMDYGPSTLEVLAEVVDAVNGKVPIITDSGYRRGTDILKGLALGAQAVMLGRTTRWALGAFGAPGVQKLLEMLQTELVEATAAAGRSTLKSIDRSLVKTNFS